MARLHIAVLPGDGIGPEVVEAARDVLATVGARWDHEIQLEESQIGWSASVATGRSLPDATLESCMRADAVLLGAIGDPAGDEAPLPQRPEAGLLRLRKELGCFANLRPTQVPEAVIGHSPLRPEVVRGTDLMIVRELAGGLYYGEPRGGDGQRAWNTLRYDVDEVDRIARVAFEIARQRRRSLTSVDKANVLEVSRLWRAEVERISSEYPDVRVHHMYVDRAAMELVLRPSRFDVILTGNLFGDILSDQAGGLAGSLGLLGSASLGGTTDLYEPVHGSAPDIAGRGMANPIGAIHSVALMLRHTFGLMEEAASIEAAVDRALGEGYRTTDLGGDGAALSTRAFAEVVCDHVRGVSPTGAGATR